MESLSFTTFDDGEGIEGRFEWGSDRKRIFDRFYDALELIESGDAKKAINRLRAIIKQDPDFIDAYNSIGEDFLERDKPEKAREYYGKAYEIGKRAIPKEFDGKMKWGFLENRPFLRTMSGLGRCYSELKRLDDAIELFEAILAYNPNDNQGVRYLLGDLYLQKGKYDMADIYFMDNADHYPPYRYSYGLSLFNQGRHADSIIQFWLGFYENIYIAELILNHHPVIDYDIFHFSNFEEPDIAKEYCQSTFAIWMKNKKAIKFLGEVFLNDSIKNGIEAVYACKRHLKYINADSGDNIDRRDEMTEEIHRRKGMVNSEAAKRILSTMGM